ncbi:unnamed protein product [Caenorhabditis bovis]|uniref:C2H2-type domain-containing protein n=1 Tax=Caenorhabditis bovis TaxID=2654633 RepID=A0A8S1EHQ6_9PELO|nr:unnamed protein product [Caenorhabditis bovis]
MFQAARPTDNAQGAFHVMPQPSWNFPVPAQIREFANKQPLLGTEWQAQSEWAANNNKLTDWSKWSTSQQAAGGNPEIHRPMPTFAGSSLSTLIPSSSNLPGGEQRTPHVTFVSPKEDDRKSSEHHTNSYDGSASQSPNNNDDAATNSSEEQIDVECMPHKEESTPTKTEVNEEEMPEEKPEEPQIRKSVIDCHKPTLEETKLLLNFSQQSFNDSVSAKSSISPSAQSTDGKNETVGFLHSGNSAFSNIGSVSQRTPSRDSAMQESGTTGNTSSFCRAPGLGPAAAPPPSNGGATPLVCPICGFSCPSKFHYNSHMNTHGDHQCTMCDYTSRTEGRLKKHMRESHTVEEQLKAGLEIEPKHEKAQALAQAQAQAEAKAKAKEAEKQKNDSHLFANLSTTMASILDSTATAFAASMAQTDTKPTFAQSIGLDPVATSNLLSNLSQRNALTTSALDQIRAFTEKSNLLPEGGLNLASALGAVSQAISGESTKIVEKNSEPRRSSSGKVKILKCKQCGHQSMSKNEQWAHARTHIPAEKQLNCDLCNFVTEYKHHLEYHYRNHTGSKPFQCKKCSYTCVNKSMLNSHMKSHTNHYQFRCVDCTYATKYCHSLKLHLKKYNHRRVPEGSELSGGDSSPSLGQVDTAAPAYNAFGNVEVKLETPTPTSIAQSLGFTPMVNNQSLTYASQMLLKQHQMEGLNPLLSLGNLNTLTTTGSIPMKCPMCDYQCTSHEDQIKHNMSHFMNNATPTTLANFYSTLVQPSSLALTNTSNESETAMEVTEGDERENDQDHEGSGHAGDDEMDQSDCAGSPTGSSKGSSDEELQRRKAFKLEQISQRLQGKSPSSSESVVDNHEERLVESSVSPSEPMSDPPPVRVPLPIVPFNETPLMVNTSQPSQLNNLLQQACLAFNALNAKREDNSYSFTCPHCRMAFQDQALYHIHMGYHGYEHAFKCNRCGFTANDSLNFNLHLLQASHE